MGYIILICIVFFVVYRFYEDIKNWYEYTDRAAAPVKMKVLPVPQVYHDILKKYFPYYRQLNANDRIFFGQRVAYFIYSKKFIPRNVDEVTVEAKVLIAATAIQLTFGLDNVYLRHFNKILVYPNEYYSSITKKFHKGEVNPRFGIIVLSWQSFVNGFINPSDSVNLGLHEMAHALRLENLIRSKEYKFFNDNLVQRFDQHAHQLCHVTNWAETFFRPYACANEHEFFAVTVENFFERPLEFKRAMPELYAILCGLLNQDPSLLPSPQPL